MPRTNTVYDSDHREFRIDTRIQDYEVAIALEPQEVLIALRHQLVHDVSKKIMEKLGPAIDDALRNVKFGE